MKKLITILVSLTIMIGQNKVGGLTYFDFTQNEDESGFNFKRQYISVAGSSGEDMKYKVVMDVGRYGDDNRLTAFLKKAQADYTTNYGKISLGLIGMNTYGVQEKNWGYRFISKSAIDKNKFSATADLGIGYSNTLMENLNLSLQLTNGEGYKKSQEDTFHKISLNATYGEMKINKNDGYNAGLVFSTMPTENDPINMISVFGGYAANNLRLGAEYDKQTSGDLEETIISVTSNYRALDNLDAYVRYDMYTDNVENDMNGENYLIAGLLLNCGNGLSLAPNVRMTSFEDSDMDNELEYKLNFQFKF
ncbi:MAG: hypothetical protein VX770_05190 [Candidatus Neomarinimicrobiota bacterium]|nr:hypothetical protein [Candidatus Neomarinimicrobiota bacterium]